MTSQIRDEEDRKYEKEKEMKGLLEEMEAEAEMMAFEELTFMQDELLKSRDEFYKFNLHQQQFEHTREQIRNGMEILSRTKDLEQTGRGITQYGDTGCGRGGRAVQGAGAPARKRMRRPLSVCRKENCRQKPA